MASTEQGKEPRGNYESKFHDFLHRYPRLTRGLILSLPKIGKLFSVIFKFIKSFFASFELPTAPKNEVEKKPFSWSAFSGKVLLVTACALATLQFSYLTGVCYRLMQPTTIVLSSHGPDAAQAIDIAVKTELLNDNGWYPYGPVYYRMAYLVRLIAPEISDLSTPEDRKQQNAHFSLMFAALISLYGMAYLLTTPLTKTVSHRIFATVILVSVLLHHELWIENTFLNNHPEVTLSWMALLLIRYLFLTLQNPGENYFLIIAALLAGIGFSTKISFMLFFPALLFVFCPPFNLGSAKNIFKFAFIAALGYFSIGFPQNFKVEQFFWFLDLHSFLDAETSLLSFLTWWKWLFLEGWLIALTLFILYVIFQWGTKKRAITLTCSNRNRILALTTIPFLILTLMNWVGNPIYYLMPFMVALFMGLGIIGGSLSPATNSKLPESWLNTLRPAGLILALIVTHNQIGIFPHFLEEKVTHTLYQTRQTKIVYSHIINYINEAKLILYDPYVPVPVSGQNNDHVLRRNTLENVFFKGKGDILIFSGSWHSRFLKKKPSEWDLAGLGEKEWWAMHNFYKAFNGKNQFTDKQGRTWKNTYSDIHNNQIWERLIANNP